MRRKTPNTTNTRPLTLVLLAAVGLLIFALIAQTLNGDNPSELEVSVFRAFNGLPGAIAYAIWPIMQIGNMAVAPVGAVITTIRREFRLSIALLLIAGGKIYAAKFIKDEYIRHRPGGVLEDVTIRIGSARSGLGFVSGHAVLAIAIAVIVHPYLRPRAARVALWACAVLVMVGRVYVGAHFPLDVVAGGAVGLALGAVVNLVVGIPRTRAHQSFGNETATEVTAETP